ncbi:MAG: ketopantoate reductase C-terminal domain-containing protein [Candidatus Dormibacteria bacterium]
MELPLTIEERMDGAAAMSGHKTSMLQDIEAGKRLDTDALPGAVIELAEARKIDVPSLRELYVLTKLAEGVALAKGSMGTQHDSPGLRDAKVHVEMEGAAQLRTWFSWHGRHAYLRGRREVQLSAVPERFRLLHERRPGP